MPSIIVMILEIRSNCDMTVSSFSFSPTQDIRNLNQVDKSGLLPFVQVRLPGVWISLPFLAAFHPSYELDDYIDARSGKSPHIMRKPYDVEPPPSA